MNGHNPISDGTSKTPAVPNRTFGPIIHTYTHTHGGATALMMTHTIGRVIRGPHEVSTVATRGRHALQTDREAIFSGV